MIKTLLAASLLAPLLNASAADQAAHEIPFRWTDGFIRLDVRLPGSTRPLSMLLDSGASVSVLNLKTAQRLKLQPGKTLAVRGVFSDSHAFELPPLPAMVSGVEAGIVDLAADMSQADSLCSEPVDGLIGADFFRDRVVQIDYGRHRLRLLKTAPTFPAGAIRLPGRIINDVLCVKVGVNGSSQRWTRLDTGCNEALHWVVPRHGAAAKDDGLSIGFASEVDAPANAVVALATQRFPRVPTVFHGRRFFDGEAGLLGNGLLSRFLVTVDWKSQLVTLSPRER